MSVYENITLLAKLNGRSDKEVKDRTDMLMTFVDLSFDFKNKYPHQLSGGEQQRIGICRAMILNPQIYLLDEAFGALDPTTKSEIHKKLLDIQNTEPRTVLFVTHDLREAFKLADTVIIIEKGVIQQIGTKDDIKNKPSNQFVENFLNSQD
jgi:osmoprotectant transport system ATP-binding protein